MKIKNIMLLFLLLNASVVYQSQAQQMARPAAKGIFLDLGKTIPKHVRYSISRKAADSSSWQQVATRHFEADSAVFFARLKEAAVKYPAFQVPEQRFLNNLWTLISSSEVTDSVLFYGNTPAFKEALGAAFYDETARPGVRYSYRIQTLRGTSVIADQIMEGSFPQVRPVDYQLVTQSIAPFAQRQVLKYYSNGIHQPAGIVLMRQVYMQNDFEPAPAYTGISKQGDSLIYLAVDTVLQQKMVYRYFALPFDELGNAGLSSDTVRIANTTFNNTPLLSDVKTESLEKEGAIRLKWKLDHTVNVSTVNIYRSETYDGADYMLIGSVSGTDTAFTDKKVHPVRNYFYSLQPVTIYGPGALSIRFSGMLKASKKANRPHGLKVRSEAGRVILSWERPEFYTRGYYIYRSRGSEPLVQVSDLVLSDSLNVSYTDTIIAAQNSTAYRYAVRAVNTSYDISGFSDTVLLNTPVMLKLNTPVGVRAILRDGKIMVFWSKSGSQHVIGYQVFRKAAAEPESAYRQVNSRPLHFSENYYQDAPPAGGLVWEYAVQAISTNGQLSARSAASVVGSPAKHILPVGGLQLSSKEGAVFLNWDGTEQPEVSGYRIYRLEGEQRVLLAAIAKELDYYQDKSATAHALNSYIVTCVAGDTESEAGMPVSIRLK